MTLPPTQNQYPGWEPPKQDAPQNINDFGADLPSSNSLNNTNVPPVQNMQPNQAQAPQPIANNPSNGFAFATQTQPVQVQPQVQLPQTNSQVDTTLQKPKKPIKGPLLLLLGMIIIFGVITGLVLLTSKKPSDNTKTSNTVTKQAAKTSTSPESTDVTSDADTSNQPYAFTVNQQIDNLKNLQTSLTTYQSQDAKKKLPAATPQGWALLKADNVIDPVTNKPYVFAASNIPNVGEVQYAAQSVCSSDNTVIASTDLGSFALRTRLYNGTYYCVDSSNARS